MRGRNQTRHSHILAISLLSVVATAIAPAAAQPAPRAARQISIADQGAVGDGKTLNTTAIQRTIDNLAAAGGGTVVIPAGTFRSGAIFLKPGVNLRIEKDGVLKGSTDVADYPKSMTRIEGHFTPWLSALVNADHCDHLRISGTGTLDGSGQPFWAAFRSRYAADHSTKNLDVERPRLVFVENSQDVQVSGVHLLNSGFWNLHLYRCQNVTVDGLDISAGASSPSTDGMDIDSCQHVTVHGCRIAVNDDCIALKGSKGPLAMEDKDSPPVEHIRVTDCTFERGGSFVTCGSEATVVRDVVVDHCRAVGHANRGMAVIRLKLRPDTPQDYQDIHFSNIQLEGAGSLISLAPWKQYFDLQGHTPPTQTVRDVSLSDVTGSFGSFGVVHGNPGDTIENLTFENINVQLTHPQPQIVGVQNLVIRNVTLNGKPYTGPEPAATQATR